VADIGGCDGLKMAFANDISGAGVEKKKPALGGLGGMLADWRYLLPAAR
jgi:hypothetical protein